MELAKVITLDPFLDGFNGFDDKICATIGQFDGVHIAHQVLLEKTSNIAKEKNLKSAVICFNPHPKMVLNNINYKGTLTSLEEKRKIISKFNIDYLIVVAFSINLAKLSYQDFEALVLDKLNIDTIVCGQDFGYGYKKEGNANTLKVKYNVCVIDLIKVNDEKIASSKIKDLLINGDVKNANMLLGHNYFISSTVKDGSKIGRKIGISTANLDIYDDENYIEMKSGVYSTIVTIDDKRYLGVCNIGNNPSFNYTSKKRLEVHILDFDEDIYGKKINVEFIDFIREEKVFASANDLVMQINKDILKVREIKL